MKSRYTKQRNKAKSRYSTRLKAQQGIHFPENQAVPSTGDIAGDMTRTGVAGSQMLSFLPGGSAAGFIGGAALAGLKGIKERKEAIEANQTKRESEDFYKENSYGYTDPKLMSMRGYAKSGEADASEGLIEIEGKKGVGELHFDKDWNLKNVGTNPHSNGGDVVAAEEGDIVIPTQGDKDYQARIMKLVNQYKHGEMDAKMKLDKIVASLPDDREVANGELKKFEKGGVNDDGFKITPEKKEKIIDYLEGGQTTRDELYALGLPLELRSLLEGEGDFQAAYDYVEEQSRIDGEQSMKEEREAEELYNERLKNQSRRNFNLNDRANRASEERKALEEKRYQEDLTKKARDIEGGLQESFQERNATPQVSEYSFPYMNQNNGPNKPGQTDEDLNYGNQLDYSKPAFKKSKDGGPGEPIIINGKQPTIGEWREAAKEYYSGNGDISDAELFSEVPVGFAQGEDGSSIVDTDGYPMSENALETKKFNEANPENPISTDQNGEPIMIQDDSGDIIPETKASSNNSSKKVGNPGDKYSKNPKSKTRYTNDPFTTDLGKKLSDVQNHEQTENPWKNIAGPVRDPSRPFGYGKYKDQDGNEFWSRENLGENGYFTDENGNDFSNSDVPILEDAYSGMPTLEMNKEQALGYLAEGKHNWKDPKELRDFMSSKGITYTEAKKYALDNYEDINEKDFGVGATDATDNAGPMTRNVFSRNYATPETASATKMPYAQRDESGYPEDVAGEGLETDVITGEKRPRGNGSFKDVLRYGNAASNMIEGFGSAETYDPTTLQLDRFRYNDMSAPRMQKANEANVIRQNNRRNMVASRGQHNAQAAQDQVLSQKANDEIMASEIERRGQIDNLNVGQRDREAQFMASEMLKKKDFDSRSRAAQRNLVRQGSSEAQDVYDVLQQESYMKSRDAKLDARNDLLMQILAKDRTQTHTLNIDAANNLTQGLRKEFKVTPTDEDEEE
jgi:hypothetical protein